MHASALLKVMNCVNTDINVNTISVSDVSNHVSSCSIASMTVVYYGLLLGLRAFNERTLEKSEKVINQQCYNNYFRTPQTKIDA